MEHIKKYENRKMYSKTQKSYVTLSKIRDMILQGKNVSVLDHKGNDITSETLMKVAAISKNVPVLDLQNLITNN